MYKFRNSLLLLVASCAFLFIFSAQTAGAAGPGSVTMTVTAVGKKDAAPPEIKREDVQLFLNKERTQVADWRRGEKLYLAVLIDDSLDADAASQWDVVKEFLKAQPRSEREHQHMVHLLPGCRTLGEPMVPRLPRPD